MDGCEKPGIVLPEIKRALSACASRVVASRWVEAASSSCVLKKYVRLLETAGWLALVFVLGKRCINAETI